MVGQDGLYDHFSLVPGSAKRNGILKSMIRVFGGTKIRKMETCIRIENAHKIMGLANTLSTQLESIFNGWTKVKVTDLEVRKLIQLALCPNKETFDLLKKGAEDEISTLFKNTVEDAFAYAMISDTQQMDTTKGTLFGAYNAVTGYYQNVRSYKNDEAKLQSIVLGGTAQLKSQKAFELCTSFALDGAEILNLN